MKRPGIDGSFILCFLLNLVLNAFWVLPAVALFVAHFIFGTPPWLAWLALALWVVVVFAITAFMNWAASSSSSNPIGTGTHGKVTVRYSSQQRPVDAGTQVQEGESVKADE